MNLESFSAFSFPLSKFQLYLSALPFSFTFHLCLLVKKRGLTPSKLAPFRPDPIQAPFLPLSSYRQIFKATSIVGGAQVITILIGLIRNKLLALFVGASGVGLFGTYFSMISMVGGITQLGLGQSGVREIAEAAGKGDKAKFERTAVTLSRTAKISAVLGLVVGLVLVVPLGLLTFGNNSHSADLILLSFVIFLSSITVCQWALLQGLCRIGELTASQVYSAFFGMLGSIAIVFIWRERGIAPGLVVSALITLWFSTSYAKRVSLDLPRISWKESFVEARALVSLGVAFAFHGMMGGAAAYLTRMLIIDNLGLAAVGLYVAGWTISSYYIQMILGAISTDFYPRLTAVADDQGELNRMVNEQLEMGVLMSVPGILAIFALAPSVLPILYSEVFIEASGLVRWMTLGVFFQVVTRPFISVVLAKNQKRIFVINEGITGIVSIAFLWVLLPVSGLEGAGMAFTASIIIAGSFLVMMGSRVSGFKPTMRCIRTVMSGSFLVLLGFAAQYAPAAVRLPLGLILTGITFIASLVVLQRLLGFSLIKQIQNRLFK